MAASHLREGMNREATFSLFVRRLPRGRTAVMNMCHRQTLQRGLELETEAAEVGAYRARSERDVPVQSARRRLRR
jgi:hypothetical protein